MILSTEDKAHILDLLQSGGWHTLTDKVWSVEEKAYLNRLCLTSTDHRFYQGWIAGFRWARTLAEECAKQEHKGAYASGTPNEFDLVARR